MKHHDVIELVNYENTSGTNAAKKSGWVLMHSTDIFILLNK